jgi:transcription elongation factor Elf1
MAITRAQLRKADWVKLDAAHGGTICERCGQRDWTPLPMPLDAYVFWLDFVMAKHRHCTEPSR